ncbi:16S rRNA (uracil(1498)-N(3))-methyltransferase [bacterium]|nr:16S rRNA (uracil(1498)-N(3))-methyltransferase [bacterium]
MTIQRLYIPQKIEENKCLYITNDDFHYIKNVIRLKVDDEILLFNEISGEFLSKIKDITKKEVIITPIKQTRKETDENLNDTELIFSSIKHNRQDLIIEKTTELGIKELSPIITKYTNNKNINIERLNTIAKEATEQSRRLLKPRINAPVSFIEKIKNFDFEKRTLVYLDERTTEKTNIEILKKLKGKPVSFLIGPEGGFAPGEFEILKQTPAIGINLGNLILRAETAAISIISIYNLGM